MWDLVGNPDNWFCFDEAYIIPSKVKVLLELNYSWVLGTSEPRRKKTGLWGFGPSPTQIRLYSHRRWLERGGGGGGALA